MTNYFGCSLVSEMLTAKSVTIDGVSYIEGDCFIFEVTYLDVPVLLRIVHVCRFDGV